MNPENYSDPDMAIMLKILGDQDFLNLARKYRDRISLYPRLCTSIAREAIRRGFAVHPRDLIPEQVEIQDFGSKCRERDTTR